MKKLKNILVPINFSEPSISGLKESVVVAKQFDSKINLFHAESSYYNPSLTSEVLDSPGFFYYTPIKTIDEDYRNSLRQIMDKHVPKKLQGNIFSERASVAKMLSKLSEDNSIDLVICGTSGRRGFEDYLFGTFAEKIVRESDIPVLLLEPGENIDFNNVLVVSDLNTFLPEKIVKFCQILESQGSTIHLSNVLTTHLISEAQVKDKLDKLGTLYDLKKYQTHVIQDDYEINGILKLLKKTNADLIMMKNYDRSNFWTLIMDSLAVKAVNRTDIPVLTEKVYRT